MSAGEATGADSNALARTLSSTHDGSGALPRPELNDESQEASAPVPRGLDDDDAPPAGGAGIFQGLMGGDGNTSDSDDDDDDGDHADRDEAALARAALSTQEASGAVSRPRDDASLDLGLDDELGDFSIPPTTSGSRSEQASSKKPQPVKRSSELPVPQAPPAPPPEVAASLGDDALDALGAAFDNLAQSPSQTVGAGDGLSDDERRFLMNIQGAPEPPPPPMSTKPTKPPPRPPEKPGVKRAAPPPRKKGAASTKLSISDEAKQAAFIALKRKIGDGIEFPDGVDPTKGKKKRPPKVRDDDPEITSPNQLAPAPPRSTSDEGMPEPPPTVPAELAAQKRSLEVGRREKPRVRRELPTVMAGLNRAFVVVAVMVGLVAGAALGAALAPKQVKRNDKRARAELAMIDGNKYYEAARYDDALAKYKNATNNDPTYTPAHRAKGAALAKLAQQAQNTQQGDQAQRLWDDAANAYSDFLTLEPSAVDAKDIKEALNRRGKRAVTPEAPSE